MASDETGSSSLLPSGQRIFSAVIGAVIRAVTAAGLGRAQTVTAGTGYWSQDSTTLIVTSAQPITALKIRWPDGSKEELPVSSDAKSLTLHQPVK